MGSPFYLNKKESQTALLLNMKLFITELSVPLVGLPLPVVLLPLVEAYHQVILFLYIPYEGQRDQ